MQCYVAFVVIALSSVQNVLSCAPGTDPKKSLENYLGGTTKLNPLTDGRTGQAITNPDEVSCYFDNICRWGNQPVTANSKYQWYQATGQPNPNTWLAATGTSEMPTEPYAIIPLGGGAGDWLMSDVINCQNPNGFVTFKYWVTKSASFQVCLVTADSARSKIQCSPTIDQSYSPTSPGPVFYQFSGQINKPFQVAFIPQGTTGFVAIDDTGYYSDDMVCATTTTSTTTTTTTLATTKPGVTATTPKPTTTVAGPTDTGCTLVPCNFETNACGYTMNDPKGQAPWVRVVDNSPVIGYGKNTQVRSDSTVGRSYLGSNVYRTQSAVAASPTFNLVQQRKLSFSYFSGTYGGRLRACFNAALTDCETAQPDSQGTYPAVTWRTFTSTRNLPIGSNKFYLVADYKTSNADYSGIAVDNIKLSGC